MLGNLHGTDIQLTAPKSSSPEEMQLFKSFVKPNEEISRIQADLKENSDAETLPYGKLTHF